MASSYTPHRTITTSKKIHPALVVILIIIILGLLQIVLHKDSFDFLINGFNPNQNQENNRGLNSQQIVFATPFSTKGQGASEFESSLGQEQGFATIPANSSYEGAYVALCLMAKGEKKFIREWVQYHKYIGVGKMYIYDHESDPPFNSSIADFISDGLVDYMYLTDQWKADEYGLNKKEFWYNQVKQVNSPQRWVHTDCFEKNREKHTFIAMIDIDEFIVLNQGKEQGYKPVSNPDLPAFLKNYEQHGGLFVYWRMYGSSGHKKAPEGGVLESYVNCQPVPLSQHQRANVKHLVNTKYMGEAFCVIHACVTTNVSVNVNHVEKTVSESKKDPTWEGISLNHYQIKSQEDYNFKRQRGGGHSPKHMYSTWRTAQFFKDTDAFCKGDCSYMKEVYKACCQ